MIPPGLVLMLLWPGAWESDPAPSPPADPTAGSAREFAFLRAERRFVTLATHSTKRRRPGPPGPRPEGP